MIIEDKQKCLDVASTYKLDKAIDFFDKNILSKNLKSDKQVAMALVSLSGKYLANFSKAIKDDESIVRVALLNENESSGWPFDSISPRLRNDIGFISSLICERPSIYLSIDESQAMNPTILKSLYKTDLYEFTIYLMSSIDDGSYSLIKTAQENPAIISFLETVKLDSGEYIKQFKRITKDYKATLQAGEDEDNVEIFNNYNWPLTYCLEKMSKKELKSLPTHKDLPEINELIDNQRQKDAVYAIRQENTNQKSKPRKQLMGF